MNTLAVPAALVEIGDLIADATLVGRGGPPLADLAARGIRTVLPWPATVDRLLAIVARHAGDLDEARRWARSALHLSRREALAPERAKSLLELARIEAAAGADDAAATTMAAAVDAFDALSMPGWLARCDALGRDLHVPPAVGSSGPIRERTILTNDVVGSTASNARLGDVLYLEQLRVHDRILRSRLAQFRGVEIKHTGDGLNIAFNDRRDAIRCALAAQRDFEAWQRDEPDLALRVRCGIAHGPLVPSGGDFFGLVQSEAARVCAVAGGGDVLATAAVVADCPPEVTAVLLGRFELAGLPGATEVFRLVDAG
jgi:class 3 adenylate cyclase